MSIIVTDVTSDYDYPPDETESQDAEIAANEALLEALLSDGTLYICVGCNQPFYGPGYYCGICLAQGDID